MLDYYAHAALRMDADWNRHCFLYATGSVQHPKHWCLLFLDSRSRTYIHFNSLGGRETQTSDPLYQALCRVGGPLNFLTNASRLQGSSKLCGFYVYHMFDRLARCESEFLADFFESTTGAKKNWSDSSIASAVPSRLAAPTNPFSNLIDHIPGLDF